MLDRLEQNSGVNVVSAKVRLQNTYDTPILRKKFKYEYKKFFPKAFNINIFLLTGG